MRNSLMVLVMVKACNLARMGKATWAHLWDLGMLAGEVMFATTRLMRTPHLVMALNMKMITQTVGI